MKCKRCEQELKPGFFVIEYCAFCLGVIVQEWEGWQLETGATDVGWSPDILTIQQLTKTNKVLRQELERLKNFRPTPDQINVLPEKLRDYIHHLETTCDPAGDQAALVCARENLEALTNRVAELTKELENARRNA